jgi:outer membrane biosynthesis protein TonB
MIFEAYQPQRHAGVVRVGRRRTVTYALSALFHGALIGAGLAYSFWSVDELAPPRLHVTLFSSVLPAPPPPPPPAPASSAAAGAPKTAPTPPTRTARPKTPPLVQPKAQPLVQPPPEEPRPEAKVEPKAEASGSGEKGTPGSAGGERGGVAGGMVGGKPGSSGGASDLMAVPAKNLSPYLGALQKERGDNPPFPPSLHRPGMVYVVLAKICVSRVGTVDKVTIMKRADPLLDGGVLSTVKASWRYRPLMEHEISVPFCYPEKFEFRSQ